MGQAPRAALAALLLAIVGRAAAAPAAMVVGNGLALACSQPEPLTLRCDYRLTGGGQPLAAQASIGNVTLPAPAFAARTGAPGNVAILLLVDTSDPGRASAIRKVEKHISRLVDGAESHHRFGLASFDDDLRLLAPVGSSRQVLKTAASLLQARGRTTELYRNVVEALRLLATATDEHKVLVVMSDGLAEDRAYFHEDAVREALAHRIAVFGIGYPRSVALAVGLQSLRRLAEETGGRFVAADQGFEIPESFFEAPFVSVHKVGALSVDLGPAAPVLPGGAQTLRLSLETSAGLVEAPVEVVLPPRATAQPVIRVVEVPKVVEVERVVEVPARPAATAGPAPVPTATVPLWYWVAAISVLALALLVLLLVLLMQRRGAPPVRARPATSAAAASAAPPPPPLSSVAQLVMPGEEDAPHRVTGAAFRIGRLSDNDLVLRDPSVSRHHAEIRRRRDGRFQILDLDSMNGVLVNGRRIRERDLADGDSLEIGDVSMTFVVPESGEDLGEDTVMAKTVHPDEPLTEAAGGGQR